MPDPILSVRELVDSGLGRGLPLATDLAMDDAAIVGAVRGLAERTYRDENLAVFDNFASIIGAVTDPAGIAAAFINAKYGELGGASGFLGATTTAVNPCPDGTGYFRHFHNGSIYYHPWTGAHEVHGAIRAKWVSLGWERSYLGYPTSDELTGRDTDSVGRVSHFQHGSILWHPTHDRLVVNLHIDAARAVALSDAYTGPVLAASASLPLAERATRVTDTIASSRVSPAIERDRIDVTPILANSDPPPIVGDAKAAQEVHGAIHAKYMGLGGEASVLGYPTTDETGTPDQVGRYNHFDAGSIYWTPATSAHEVHGLIRDLWASQGWERGPMGYPITDELIPDRRIGHVHPEHNRKPIHGVPLDVVKFPADAKAINFPATVVNTAPQPGLMRLAMHRENGAAPLSEMHAALADHIGVSAITGAIDRIGDDRLVSVGDNRIIDDAISIIKRAASTPGPDRSANRFSDFENGVLFWERGATKADVLSPWSGARDGTKTSLTAADVAAGSASLMNALHGIADVQSVNGPNFVGTTPYSFDGVQVHNRRHRFQVELDMAGGLFDIFSGGAKVTVELHIEVAFQPLDRSVSGTLADWHIASTTTSLAPDLLRSLHQRLDSKLWARYELLPVEDTDDGEPFALLSTKVMGNGDVKLFIEPAARFRSAVATALTNTVTTALTRLNG